MFKKRIYLDYAALTPIDREVMRTMKKYSSSEYANPASLYKEGVAAKKALSHFRKSVADFIHAHPDEIIFTSGGTEANGLALEGVARAAFEEKKIAEPHIIISAIEHSSVTEVVSMMEKHGTRITRIPVDSNGIIILDELKKAITPETVLISVMTVNNETGTVQPIREIAKIIRQARRQNASIYPLFHTDAAQAALYLDLTVEKLGVDLLTLDGSKVYGPRGIGCLYIKRETPIQPIMYGGGQETGMRSGTENIPAIAGFSTALEITQKDRASEVERIGHIHDYFVLKLKSLNLDIKINGFSESSINVATENTLSAQSPHILNVSIPGIDNEFFVLQLDAAGIACSTKSSCLHDSDESYVLTAMKADSKSSVRFSFGKNSTGKDIDTVIRVISKILPKKVA